MLVIVGRRGGRLGSTGPGQLDSFAKRGEAGDQVPQSIGQVRLIRRLEPRQREVGVLEGVGVAEQEVAHRIRAETVDVRDGIGRDPARLADLRSLVGKEAVHHNPIRNGQPGG